MDENEYLHLGDELYHVLIPESYPLDLKLMVLAALKTFRLGNKSMDHVLKKYADAWAEQFDVECFACGRRLRIKLQFHPRAEDFMAKCQGCGQLFCKNCLESEISTKDTGPFSWDKMPVLCRKCRIHQQKKRIERLKMRPKTGKSDTAQIIDMETKRKK